MRIDLRKIRDTISSDLTAIGMANILGYTIIGIFWFYVASLLGSEQYGKISYFFAIANIASVFSFLGVGNTLVVFTAKQVKIQTPLYFISIFSSVIISVILFVIFYDLGVSLFVIGYVIFNLITSEMLGRKLYNTYSKFFITQRLLVITMSSLLYYVMGERGIILGFALSYLPYSFKLYAVFKKSQIKISMLKPQFRFMMNSYGLDLSRILNNYVDKLIIYPLFGYSLLGNYQLGTQLLMFLNIIPFTVYQYVLAHDASGIAKTKLKKYTVFLSVGFALSGVILSPIVIPIFFHQFYKAVEIIQIMSLASIPIAINQMYFSKFLGNAKSNVIFIGSGIFLGIQILSILVLGHYYGILGAAAGTVLAASSECLYLINSSRRL